MVFGDIGTSPLYALREAIDHARSGVGGDLAVIGVVSLAFWALMVVVTFKYVFFLMRADNKGEGGTLSLMALAQFAVGRRSAWIFILAFAARPFSMATASSRPPSRSCPPSKGCRTRRVWPGGWTPSSCRSRPAS